jgi:3-dehydroquinate dehydratase-2
MAREAWRGHSIISPAVKGTIQGLGVHSYLLGLRGIVALAKAASKA